MADVARANAIARRDSLSIEIQKAQLQLEELRREAKRVDEWLSAWDAFAGVSSAGADDVASRLLDERPVRKGRSANPPKEQIAEFAVSLALSRGAPVLRNAVAAALEQEGTTLVGTDPDMVLSTMLWRMRNRVVHLKGFGYWPRDQVYRPAGYDPNTGGTDDTETEFADDAASRDEQAEQDDSLTRGHAASGAPHPLFG